MDSDEVVHILKRRPTRSPAAENKPLSNQLDDEDEEVAIKKRPRRSCTPAKKTPSAEELPARSRNGTPGRTPGLRKTLSRKSVGGCAAATCAACVCTTTAVAWCAAAAAVRAWCAAAAVCAWRAATVRAATGTYADGREQGGRSQA